MDPAPSTIRAMDTARIEKAVREILEAVGEDPEREGLRDTPARVARFYAEVLGGIEAEHLCMSMRGIKKPGATTVTSAVRGTMASDAATRAEAMSLLFGTRG